MAQPERPDIKKLEDEEHDTSDWKQACEKALMQGDTIYIGLFFEKQAATLGDQEPILDEGGPLALCTLGLTKEQAERVVKRMMLVNFGSS